MMKDIIFLTKEIKDMIVASGLSLDSLTSNERRQHFSSEDLYNIDYMTTKAREEGGILAYYGFGFKSEASALQSTNRLIVPKASIDSMIEKADHRSTPLEAYCPNQDTIILWQAETNDDSTHYMFKANLREILKAMTRVLSLEKVLSSTQFEINILRG